MELVMEGKEYELFTKRCIFQENYPEEKRLLRLLETSRFQIIDVKNLSGDSLAKYADLIGAQPVRIEVEETFKQMRGIFDLAEVGSKNHKRYLMTSKIAGFSFKDNILSITTRNTEYVLQIKDQMF